MSHDNNEKKPVKDTWEMPTLRALMGEIGSAAVGGMIHSFIETPIVIPIEASITQTQINGRNFFWNFDYVYICTDLTAICLLLFRLFIGFQKKKTTDGLSFIRTCLRLFFSCVPVVPFFVIKKGSMRDATLKQSVTVGLATGGSEVILSTPLNFLKFRMQRPEWGYKGLLDAIRRIAKEEGIGAYWKGTLPTFCRNSTCMAGMLGGISVLKPLFPQDFARKNLLAGMGGGLIGSLISYPFEMWRAARMHNRNFYEEMWSRGPRRMLAGWAPGATRLVITSGIMGELLPRLKQWANAMSKEDAPKQKTEAKPTPPQPNQSTANSGNSNEKKK
ncbi:hypothetical protein RFI_06914 [Reticulomyxa filosa]|uniref:Mitochondrial carrier protein n=1 Tax=Reticulomyxa filosa TaxID=46433 RepID=X6NV72_RETFI|nr:hypothetical protein RFI_06914 [Reticulomyxa filosa]|eukprot:ETO30210.1 hypothetical protein RFI_06914 [Reticulomyxa filosa]